MVEYKVLKFIMFSELDKWDVKRFFTDTITSKYAVVSLADLLLEESEKEKPYNFPDNDFGILGISNDNGMFDAYTEKGRNIKQPYKIVRNDYIAYNPYRINVGSIGIKKNNLQNAYISSAYVVFSTNNRALPDYTYLLMQTHEFNKQIKEHTTGSVRQTLSFENLCHISIPLPPLEVQQSLVRQYHAAMAKAQALAQEACAIQDEADNYILDTLGIETKGEHQEKHTLLHFVKLSSLYNWNVKYAMQGFNPATLLASTKYKSVPLRTVCDINPATQFPKELQTVAFLPMECISDVYGEVIEQKTIAASTKGYTRFKDGDVIFAKITPCMQNGKCAVVKDLTSGYGLGSTEFHVFRAKDDSVLPEYLYCLLRTRHLRTAAINYFTGSSGQQRVNAAFFENLYIPLPSAAIQQEIVSRVNTAKEDARSKRQRAAALQEKAKADFANAVF